MHLMLIVESEPLGLGNEQIRRFASQESQLQNSLFRELSR